MKLYLLKYLILTICFSASLLFSQELDITGALKEIEAGNSIKAGTILKDLKAKNPDDPSVIFLEGVLTRNGEAALEKYNTVYEKYPKSKYADAALFRIFNYYYSLGYYKKAESLQEQLKKEYPQSPYLNSADREIPIDEETADSPPPPLEKKEPVNESQYNFTVQAGAFLNSDNATKLRDQLINDGYESEVTNKEIGGSVFNIVSVGKFVKEDDAGSLLDFLKSKYSINGRIVELSQVNSD